jgi:hypothetical protein
VFLFQVELDFDFPDFRRASRACAFEFLKEGTVCPGEGMNREYKKQCHGHVALELVLSACIKAVSC